MISLIRKQIWNERKSNVNLFIELLLFSVLTWYIVDFIYIHMLAHFSPKGFDTTNCYTVGVDVLPEESEDYSPDASKTMNNDLFKIVDRLKQIPEVDAVCLSYRSAHPYGNSWRQDDFECVTDTMIHCGKYDIQTVSSDFFNVFRYRGSNGETPDMMAKQFESMSLGDIFTTDNIRKSNHADISATDYIGKTFRFWMPDSIENTNPLHTLINCVAAPKSGDFDLHPLRKIVFFKIDLTALASTEADKTRYIDVDLRLKENVSSDFIAQFIKTELPKYREGNLLISNLTSFNQLRDQMNLATMIKFRNYLIGMSFLLINLFLGLLGIFWFRTRQRRGEIALHKALGASKQKVFMNLIAEGVILLTLATIPAIIIDYFIVVYELTTAYQEVYFTSFRFVSTVFITYLLMLVMIVIGIGIPAWRAMQIEPAEALHEE